MSAYRILLLQRKLKWAAQNHRLGRRLDIAGLVELNNRAKRNVCKIHTNEQILVEDAYLFTYILEIQNIHQYELAKYLCTICDQILPNEITKDHQYTSNYHDYHTRQLDKKILTIPLNNNNILFTEAPSQWFSTWGSRPRGSRSQFFWGLRELLIKIFKIINFIFRIWNHFLW